MKTQITAFSLAGIIALNLLTLPFGAANPAQAVTTEDITVTATNALTPGDAETVYSLAVTDAQSYQASAKVMPEPLNRGTYSATTPEEIQAKKEAEAAAAAAEKAKQEAMNRARTAGSTAVSNAWMNADKSTCTGNVCWPLTHFNYRWDNNGFHTPSRPTHDGWDMLAPALTPIYAVTDGVVETSAESVGGYGVAIIIRGNVNGQNVRMTYGHMTHGTRAVQVGQQVKAGQIIGLVGSTGRSTANHLHLEIRLNGSLIDPRPWMEANAH